MLTISGKTLKDKEPVNVEFIRFDYDVEKATKAVAPLDK